MKKLYKKARKRLLELDYFERDQVFYQALQEKNLKGFLKVLSDYEPVSTSTGLQGFFQTCEPDPLHTDRFVIDPDKWGEYEENSNSI